MDNKMKTFGYFAGAAVSAVTAVICSIFGVNEIKKHNMEMKMLQASSDTVVNALNAQDDLINELKNDLQADE